MIPSNPKFNFPSLLILIFFCIHQGQTLAQTAAPDSSNPTSILSAYLFKQSSQRGGFDYATLEPFQKGLTKVFDVSTKYGNIYLGGDFFENSSGLYSCDPIVAKMTKGEDKVAPISDGHFFIPVKFTQIEDLEGYYYFKNSKFLNGLIPNSEVWMKIEAYKTANTSEKNCLVIKLLIPSKVNGVIKNEVYLLKSDGKIILYTSVDDVEFSKRKDFPNYWIVPINDPNDNSHLSGKGFSILGSFVKQPNCKNLWGLLYPIGLQGDNMKSIFFRKVAESATVKF